MINKCEWCGKEFEAKTNRKRFCSSSCQAKNYYHTHPESRRKRIECSRKRWAENPETSAATLAAGKRWRENNRDKASAATKRWRQANPERVKAYGRKWWDANPEKQLEYSRRWRKEHPLRSRVFDRVKAAKRRAEKAGNGGDYTVQEFLDLCEQYNWKCAYCGCDLTLETATGDHMIPLSSGGSSDISNIAPACRSCNSHKHNKTPEEYAEWLQSVGEYNRNI